MSSGRRKRPAESPVTTGATGGGEGPGTLFLCATPLGNLGDITLRALEVLRQAEVILAEDTRRTLRLLNHYEIHCRLVSFHDHNERIRTPQVLEWLGQGRQVVLVSDAGSPGIADPGVHLVREVIDAGLPVTALPGPCALIPALTLSGLPTHAFVFNGFVPRKAKQRQELLAELRDEGRTAVFYESPHRMVTTLETVVEILGAGRPVAVARELTKKFETVIRGTAAEVLAHFRRQAPQGEIVLIIGGKEKKIRARRASPPDPVGQKTPR